MVDWALHTARMIKRLGREVTLIPAVLPARKVTAVFTAVPATTLDVDGFAPTLRLTTADAAELARGDGVRIAAADYRIVRLQPDVDAGDVLATLQAT
jgi:hypothetical protein